MSSVEALSDLSYLYNYVRRKLLIVVVSGL